MNNHPNTQVRVAHPPTPGGYIPMTGTQSVLPSEISKARAIGIVCAALHVMGLPRSAITAWRSIADQTEATAWSSPTESPINYRKAKDLARMHCVSDRHWRRIEDQLERAGVLARATSDNGFRGKICKGTIIFGLDLEPAIRNFATVREWANRPELAALEHKRCLGQIRALRQRLKKYDAFMPLCEEHRCTWDGIEAEYRPARPGYASLTELEVYLGQLVEMEQVVRQRFEATSSIDAVAQTTTGTYNMNQQSNPESTTYFPTPPSTQQPLKLTKMSGAADSHVRHQCNLEDKIKHLNAYDELNYKNPEGPEFQKRLKAHEAPAEDAVSDKNGAIEVANNLQIRDVEHQDDESIGSNQPTTPQGSTLPPGYPLHIGSITNIHVRPEILNDIRKHKSGTKCAALDPQHIWDRFRRYNLKRDKQILPIAALRAFIAGWIVDQKASFVKKSAEGAIRADNSENTLPCPPRSRDEILDFYANLIKTGGFIPAGMITNMLKTELVVSGKVSNGYLSSI